jgi:hypothetical protein
VQSIIGKDIFGICLLKFFCLSENNTILYSIMYRVVKSPKYDKKFRVVGPDGRTVDFGAQGYSDYTLHKNPFRMRLYVGRHGGRVSARVAKETSSQKVHSAMLKVRTSTKEDWTKRGIMTAGFWSRWLLWSDPSLSGAKRVIEKLFGVKVSIS